MRCWSITESKADCYVKICLVDETGAGDGALSVLAARWGLEHDEDNLMALVMTPEHLELRKLDEPKLGGIFVDFVGGAMAHRRKFGGGRGEAVSKAVGIKGSYLPDVVDATAGLGRDAFVLASVGCRVRMLERNPVVAALLDDGLTRGYADPEIGPWLQERLQLIHASSLTAPALPAHPAIWRIEDGANPTSARAPSAGSALRRPSDPHLRTQAGLEQCALAAAG